MAEHSYRPVPTDSEISHALAWIDRVGSLVDFPCQEDAIQPLFLQMRGRGLIRQTGKKDRIASRKTFVLTPAGRAFIAVVGEASDG